MSIESHILDHLDELQAQPGTHGPVIAFFDLDQTLISGYSALALVWEGVRSRQVGMGQVARKMLANIDRRGGGRHYTALYRSLVSGLAGMNESVLRELGERAFERSLGASMYREARQIVQRHQQLGHKVVIVSAATRYQVEPIARALGIEEICCTTLKLRDGELTGEFDGPLCYGEGKLLAARRSARRHGARLRQAWFYSDSRDDLPLLKKVGYPVATNPSPALAEYAQTANWPVLKFCSRGKPNLESVLRTALMTNTLMSTAAAGAASWLMSGSREKATNLMSSWLGDVGAAVAGLDFEVYGREYLESVRPAIFTFNHQSYLDSVVMAHLLRHDFVAFCKREVGDNKLLGPLLRAHGTIFVDRNAKDQSVCMEQAKQALQGGKSLVIAPEGTRSSTGEMHPFKPGAFYLAKKMQVPIVPVVLHNVSDALPKGKLLLRPATIQVTVLPPIQPSQLRNLRAAAAQLREHYKNVLDAPWDSCAQLNSSAVSEQIMRAYA
ncbi:MAG: HAD-IB family hydrolase [Gammaproteobacteria bacterium]|nr:HAD-IB family hydrolase [Gammaproteobacteria bacterium]